MRQNKFISVFIIICFVFNLLALPKANAKITYTKEELLAKTYNYRKLRNQLLCRDTDTKNLTCLWSKVELIFSKKKLNKNDITDEMKKQELALVDKKITIQERRYNQVCLNVEEKPQYCGFLENLIKKAQYLLTLDEYQNLAEQEEYLVTNIVDGDTIDLNINGERVRARLIGINTPEHGEDYFDEAKERTKELLEGQYIMIEKDDSQSEYDKYDRLLVYVILSDGSNFGKIMIKEGLAKEYTYKTAYKYQSAFKEAETEAINNKKGIWNDETSSSTTNNTYTVESGDNGCTIKGNINWDGEKLYHLPSCPSYSRTQINTSDRERWFCSEEEAIEAGWSKAGNCE